MALLPGVYGRAPLWHACTCPVFCCFAILDARGFLEPLIFLEIARENLHFYQNLIISPEMKNERIFDTIRSKGR